MTMRRIPQPVPPAPPANPKADAPPPPSYATKDELQAFSVNLQTLTSKLAEIGGQIDVLSNQSRQPAAVQQNNAPQAPSRTVTQEHIDAAIDAGDFRKVAQLQRTMQLEDIREQETRFASQLQQLQQAGSAAISNLVVGRAEKELPYYNVYRAEIEKFISQMPADARTNAELYKFAHDAVVGAHIDEIKQKEREMAVRQQMDGGTNGYKPGEVGQGRIGSNNNDPNKSLTLASVYGENAKDIQRLLDQKGITLAQHAKKLGYADEQTFLKNAKLHLEVEQGAPVATE